MWAFERVFYQFYPLGMTGAPYENDGVLTHNILQVRDWIPHLKKLGVGAVYFSPLFESDTHGYNTRDYKKIDTRLGTNEDFTEVCRALHEADIKVVLDGVFNHVGRGFWAFRDVQEKKWDSPYKDWFHLSFDGNSNYNDGFWYEGWEGNYDLVKLNLQNPAVKSHLLECVKSWIDEYDIDGLRLDVAYMVDRGFLSELRSACDSWKQEFFLVGEMLHGDYKVIMNDSMCHSVTNYECYKGIYSSLNSGNLFEIVHSLKRQFGPEEWTLYKGKHMFSFVDNHDVSRIASILTKPEHVALAFGLAFGMPGIPIIYYGSEWGIKGNKSDGDPSLRPAIRTPEWNELTDKIAGMAKAFNKSKALQYGDFSAPVLENLHCILERNCDGDRMLIAINCEDNPWTVHMDFRAGHAFDPVSGMVVDFGGGLTVPGNTVMFLHPFAERDELFEEDGMNEENEVFKTAGESGVTFEKRPFVTKEKLEEIAAKVPTPFHIYDEAGIRENAKKVYEAFSWNPGFKEYFAVKATPNPFIMKVLADCGCGVDCSSYTELMLSEACGITGKEIMFSANETPAEEYAYADKLGAIINLDDITHIDFLKDTIGHIPETISCRFNPGGVFEISNGIMDNPGDAKYGMTRDQLFEAYTRLKELGANHFGLHAFLVSNTVTNDYYPVLARTLFELVVELSQKTGCKVEFINLSGGVGIPYEPDQKPNDIMAIGEGVKKAYDEILVPAGLSDIAIYTEMGRFMMGPYGALVTRAIHEKHTYKEYIGVDACAANLMRPAMYGSYHHLTVMGKEDAPCDHKYDVVGSLCENNDKFAIDRMLPEIEKGDLIYIHDTGAHGFAMGYNYNGRLRSAEVLLHTDGSWELIRRGETPADYFATFDCFPEFASLVKK